MPSEPSALMLRPQRHPIVRTLAAFPIACFTCALFTDIAYVQTTRMMWADFSDWLLAVGMAGGVAAAFAGLVGLILHRRRDNAGAVWPAVLGTLLVLIIALFNNLVHSRDAWTSVMPAGLALSALTVLVMLATAVLSSKTNTRRDAVMPFEGIRQ